MARFNNAGKARTKERGAPNEPAARERGQITVLTIGFVVLALMLASVVMAVTAVYVEHKKLLSLADGSALAAADTFLAGDVGERGSPAAFLVKERVVGAATSYLADVDAYSRHDRLTVAPGTGSSSGGTATVVLTAVAHPPLVSFLVPDGILVQATSTSRSRLTQ